MDITRNPHGNREDVESGRRAWIGLAVFLVVTFAGAWIAGSVTGGARDPWYQALRKPDWTPPEAVFGPVWILLYVTMAIAAWLVWRRGGTSGSAGALGLYTTQLIFNVLWSVLFFGMRLPGVALADILLLWAFLGLTFLAFVRIRRLAGLLLLPYWAWVTFAAALNLAIWQMNP